VQVAASTGWTAARRDDDGAWAQVCVGRVVKRERSKGSNDMET